LRTGLECGGLSRLSATEARRATSGCTAGVSRSGASGRSLNWRPPGRCSRKSPEFAARQLRTRLRFE
jgi:hypothetical protein